MKSISNDDPWRHLKKTLLFAYRYALCFIPSSDQQWRCRQIADAGFCVAF